MGWTSPKSKNQRQEDESTDDHDLERREPEFKLAKVFDSNVVERDNRDQEYSNEDSRIDFLGLHPVLNNQRGGCQLIRSDDNVFKPIGLTIVSITGSKSSARDDSPIREQNRGLDRRSG